MVDARGIGFSTTPSRGGRGGCFYPVRRIFQQFPQGGSVSRRHTASPTHFPAIPIPPETPSCGIVRATRESGFPHGSEWNRMARRFFMGFNDAAGVKTANLFYVLGALLSSLGRFLLLRLEWILVPPPGFTAGGAAPVDSGKRLIMKIMIFCIKLDKFTGFFDKFLQSKSMASCCNQKSYHINLSVPHSDTAVKKVFRRPRISPQQPAFPPAASPP